MKANGLREKLIIFKTKMIKIRSKFEEAIALIIKEELVR
jgi:hypothetical protein